MQLFIGRVLEDAIFDRPTVTAIGVTKMPAGGVFAIEEGAEALFIGG